MTDFKKKKKITCATGAWVKSKLMLEFPLSLSKILPEAISKDKIAQNTYYFSS